MRAFCLCVAVAALIPGAVASAQPESNVERTEDTRQLESYPVCTTSSDVSIRGTGRANVWPGGIVYYQFDANVNGANQAQALAAIAQLEAVCALDFRVRSGQASYIHIQSGSGNNANFIGWRPSGRTTLNVTSWSNIFIIAHEIMHALGFEHEMTRPDRDDYVTIVTANIQAGREHNFNINPNAIAIGQYDFSSVMHYTACAFSTCCPQGATCACPSNCQPITPLPAYAGTESLMGNRSSLSSGDQSSLAALYGLPGAPANQHCRTAETLKCGDSIIGSTALSSHDFRETCVTSNSAKGVWYRIIGTGLDFTASTCNPGTDFDTKLTVYGGGCDLLTCIDGNDDQPGSFDPACETTGNGANRGSAVTWSTTAETEYLILVHGFSTNSGDFELTVTAPQPPNDLCSVAIAASLGDVISGNTVCATQDMESFCGTADGTGGGLWYTIVGTGGRITATTCNPGTNYDTKIRIFEGSCNSLICVDGNDDGSPESFNPDPNCVVSETGSANNRASTVTWQSALDVTYRILVHGFIDSEGDFELSFIALPPPANDDCANATDASDAGPFNGSLVRATNDGSATCGLAETSPDIWYRYTAACAGQLIVDTFGTRNANGSLSGPDTVLSLHTDCPGTIANQIQCNDDTVGNDSQVGLDMLSGETVYVRLAFFLGSTAARFGDGATKLNVYFTPASSPPNDDCGDEIAISCGDTVTGCTIGGSVETLGFCDTSDGLGGAVWYTYTGTGDDVVVTTCHPGTTFDTKVRVFRDSCTSPVCVAGNDDGSPDGLSPDPNCVVPETGSPNNRASTVQWTSTPGVQYFILVHGFGGAEGNFEMSLTCTPDGCLCDWNDDGPVDVTDLLAYLALWFALDPAADVNGGGVAVTDLLDFLSCWFPGSAIGTCP